MADIAALCSMGYYDLRLGQDWKANYPHIREWFNRLHEVDSVKETVPPTTLN